MSKQSELGKWGEVMATNFFEKNGFTIEANNYRWRKKEIDLIVSSDREIIFVEVKTRTVGILSAPEDALTKAKQKHLVAAANAYIEENNTDKEARFDVITIWSNGTEHKLKHIPNAFGPRW
ncbi:MAG: YraN family protein [Salinivirgaceae bacterium]|jgi:putative endonuclease|nr:YraN family protein [Salinivirgaceae bacterium]